MGTFSGTVGLLPSAITYLPAWHSAGGTVQRKKQDMTLTRHKTSWRAHQQCTLCRHVGVRRVPCDQVHTVDLVCTDALGLGARPLIGWFSGFWRCGRMCGAHIPCCVRAYVRVCGCVRVMVTNHFSQSNSVRYDTPPLCSSVRTATISGDSARRGHSSLSTRQQDYVQSFSTNPKHSLSYSTYRQHCSHCSNVGISAPRSLSSLSTRHEDYVHSSCTCCAPHPRIPMLRPPTWTSLQQYTAVEDRHDAETRSPGAVVLKMRPLSPAGLKPLCHSGFDRRPLRLSHPNRVRVRVRTLKPTILGWLLVCRCWNTLMKKGWP